MVDIDKIRSIKALERYALQVMEENNFTEENEIDCCFSYADQAKILNKCNELIHLNNKELIVAKSYYGRYTGFGRIEEKYFLQWIFYDMVYYNWRDKTNLTVKQYLKTLSAYK